MAKANRKFREKAGRPIEVMIATPYFGRPSPKFWISIIKLLTTDIKLQNESAIRPMNLSTNFREGFPLDQQRNILVKDFMDYEPDEQSPDDRIVFIDSDAWLNKETLNYLIDCDVDMVTPIIVHGSPPHKPAIYRLDEKGIYRTMELDIDIKAMSKVNNPKDALLEIDGCGMHCVMIKRKVFQALQKPYFKWETDVGNEKTTLGEDLYFCRKVKEAGFRMHLCALLGTGHIKEAIYSFADTVAYRNVGVQIGEKSDES